MKSGSARKTNDIFGIDVNKGTHRRDSEPIMDDDEELLAIDRNSNNSFELGSSVASYHSLVTNNY